MSEDALKAENIFLNDDVDMAETGDPVDDSLLEDESTLLAESEEKSKENEGKVEDSQPSTNSTAKAKNPVINEEDDKKSGLKAIRWECFKKMVRRSFSFSNFTRSNKIFPSLTNECTAMHMKRLKQWLVDWTFESVADAKKFTSAVGVPTGISITRQKYKGLNPAEGEFSYYHLDRAPPLKSLVYLSNIPYGTKRADIIEAIPKLCTLSNMFCDEETGTRFAWLVFYTHQDAEVVCNMSSLKILDQPVSLILVTFPRDVEKNSPSDLKTIITTSKAEVKWEHGRDRRYSARTKRLFPDSRGRERDHIRRLYDQRGRGQRGGMVRRGRGRSIFSGVGRNRGGFGAGAFFDGTPSFSPFNRPPMFGNLGMRGPGRMRSLGGMHGQRGGFPGPRIFQPNMDQPFGNNLGGLLQNIMACQLCGTFGHTAKHCPENSNMLSNLDVEAILQKDRVAQQKMEMANEIEAKLSQQMAQQQQEEKKLQRAKILHSVDVARLNSERQQEMQNVQGLGPNEQMSVNHPESQSQMTQRSSIWGNASSSFQQKKSSIFSSNNRQRQSTEFYDNKEFGRGGGFQGAGFGQRGANFGGGRGDSQMAGGISRGGGLKMGRGGQGMGDGFQMGRGGHGMGDGFQMGGGGQSMGGGYQMGGGGQGMGGGYQMGRGGQGMGGGDYFARGGNSRGFGNRGFQGQGNMNYGQNQHGGRGYSGMTQNCKMS